MGNYYLIHNIRHMKFASIATIAALAGSAQAWNAAAHILVAKIAEEVLKKEMPDKLKEADKVLNYASTINKKE